MLLCDTQAHIHTHTHVRAGAPYTERDMHALTIRGGARSDCVSVCLCVCVCVCAGPLVHTGLVSGFLSGAADRLLLATSPAKLLNASLAAGATLFTLATAAGLMVSDLTHTHTHTHNTLTS